MKTPFGTEKLDTMKFLNKKSKNKIAIVSLLSVLSLNTFADGAPLQSSMENPLALMMVIIAVALLLAIGMLAYVLNSVARMYYERKEKETTDTTSNAITKALAMIGLCVLCSSSLFAQDAATTTATTTVAKAASSGVGGLDSFTFYLLFGVISLEIIVILVMAYYVKSFTTKEKPVTAPAFDESLQTANLATTWKKIWERMNNFHPQQEETKILIQHDYDGIRELDNMLPRWWVWGFVFTVVFAGVYLWRFEVAHSAPNSIQEFHIAMAQAEEQKEAYLKHAASNIDENTVTLMTDATTIDEGRKLFTSNCSPCHGDRGQGIVGPNLTDDYWLHGGSIHDVFKTIKYGYPEKGMKSWKDDFAPMQIASIASFVKSLHGTNPVNPKAPQGELYKDADSPKKDSLNLPKKKHEELTQESKDSTGK